MKTVLLTDAFLPHAGGSRTYYYNLYRRLATDFGETVTVLTRKSPGWQEFDRQAPRELRIRRFGQRSHHVKWTQWPKVVPYFGAAIAATSLGRCDVVHTGDMFPAGITGALLSRMADTPYVVYNHAEEIPQSQGYRLQPKIRGWVYRNATALVAACNLAAQQLVDIGVDRNKIHVITPGVDWERFAPKAKSERLIQRYALEGKLVALTIGRLIRRKGQETVLRAMSELKDRRRIRYVIAGTGPHEQRLRTLAAEFGLLDNVVFAGYVPEDELADLYNVCDVFVMPNTELPGGDIEGFGMVFMEASAAGKPVIAGRSGGTVDAVRDGITGFLLPPDDPAALRVCLERLLENEELRRCMGDAALKIARSEFDWKTRAAALHELNLSLSGPRSVGHSALSAPTAVRPRVGRISK